jgi:hypothetical protein
VSRLGEAPPIYMGGTACEERRPQRSEAFQLIEPFEG